MAAPAAVTRNSSSGAAQTTAAEQLLSMTSHYRLHFPNSAMNLARAQLLWTGELSSQAGLPLLANGMRHQNPRPSGMHGEAYGTLDNNFCQTEIAIQCASAGVT